jgi:hypothetical protein
MSHLDEGTLHALLDGELDAKEMREIQAHLGSCSACGTRLQSVKEIAAESERLVGVIQFPGTPRRPAALDPAPAPARDLASPVPAEPVFGAEAEFQPPPAEYEPPAPYDAPAGPPRPADRRIGSDPIYDQAPPVLLVPDEYQWAERRRRMLALSRWAALIVVAVGAGYIANEVRRTDAVPVPAVTRSAPPEETAPVLSSAEETARPDSLLRPAAQSAPARETPPPPAAKPAPAPAAPPRQAAKLAEEPAADLADAAGAADASAGKDLAASSEEPAVEEPAPSPNVREEAAEALAQLDRERRRERAAAATAALDNAARRQAPPVTRAAAQPEAAPPPPAPRTLEQRSNIYLRIGLDEAARQLGRPVHVIEGMQQQFMGLAQGVASPAADATRPVVRVVYQDNQGRMILLDQQRIRPGQTWGTGDTRWVVGEIGLSLLGEPGPEILRNLRPRVR